ERPQKYPAHHLVALGLQRGAPEEFGDAVEQTATASEECVGPLACGREARDVRIQPPPRGAPRRVAKDAIGRGRACVRAAVGLDQLNRPPERLEWNRREIRRGFLVRAVNEAVAGQRLPVVDPVAADAAVAVVNE